MKAANRRSFRGQGNDRGACRTLEFEAVVGDAVERDRCPAISRSDFGHLFPSLRFNSMVRTTSPEKLGVSAGGGSEGSERHRRSLRSVAPLAIGRVLTRPRWIA